MTPTTRGPVLATLTKCASVLALTTPAVATPPLTRDQLANRANAICTRAIAEQRALPSVTPTSTRAQIRGLFDGIYRIERRQLGRLARLTPPAPLANTYNANLVRHEQFNQAIRAVVVKLGTRQPVQAVLAEGIPEITRRSDAFDRIARTMGHTACTDPNHAPGPAGTQAA